MGDFRVNFKDERQKEFILKALDGESLKQFNENNADLNLNYSTLKNYYQRKHTLPLEFFKRLLLHSNEIDCREFDFEIIPKDWWQSSAGKKGIRSLFRKYDAEILRKWRSKGGWRAYNLKKILLPERLTDPIAELVGAYIGDGTLTEKLIRISGDKRFDHPYFNYLANLVYHSFGFRPSIRAEKIKKQLYLELCSKQLCDYFQNEFGFKCGDKIKNKLSISENILDHENLFFACLRGLVDTDGSVSKDGGILSIRFSSHNKTLIDQLVNSKFAKRFFTFANAKEIGTRSYEKIRNYFALIGSSNLRHIVRFCEYQKGNLIKKEDVINYYLTYNNIMLPYKISLLKD